MSKKDGNNNRNRDGNGGNNGRSRGGNGDGNGGRNNDGNGSRIGDANSGGFSQMQLTQLVNVLIPALQQSQQQQQNQQHQQQRQQQLPNPATALTGVANPSVGIQFNSSFIKNIYWLIFEVPAGFDAESDPPGNQELASGGWAHRRGI